MQTVDFRHFALAPGDRVLDLGCGEGRHVRSACLEPGVHAVGVDLSLDDLRMAQQKFSELADLDAANSHFGLASANALASPTVEQFGFVTTKPPVVAFCLSIRAV